MILCFYSQENTKAFFTNVFGLEIRFLKGVVQDYDFFDNVEEIEILCVFTSSKLNRENIEKFPNLKMIASRSTGYNHIDLDITREKDIIVSNVPFYGTNTVAEYAFSLILAISRKAFYTYEKVKKDLNFSRRGTEEIKGFDLKGKTIGIIGAGSIGKHSVKIAHGFGMNILAFDINPDLELEKKYGVKFVDIDTLLSSSDILTLHVPYNKHTHHLIDSSSFKKIKKGAVLINTSRGEIIDTMALKKALDEKIISFAALDVLEYEDLLGREVHEKIENTSVAEKITEINNEFIKMENVIITPHNAFNTVEAIRRILNTTEENIKSFKNGKIKNSVK